MNATTLTAAAPVMGQPVAQFLNRLAALCRTGFPVQDPSRNEFLGASANHADFAARQRALQVMEARTLAYMQAF